MEVVAVMLCLATVTGFLGRLWWICELTSHFPLHMAAGLSVFAMVWVAKRRWRMVTICGVFAAINAGLVLSVLWPGEKATPQAGARLRLAAINVHTSNHRSDLVLEFLRSVDADAILLMEVNERWMDALSPLKATYPHLIAEPREDNFGIALFSRLPLTNSSVIEPGSVQVPSIATDMTVGAHSVHLLCTHPLPPGSSEYARLRNEQLQQIAGYVRRRNSPVIVLGDLNVTPWSPYFSGLLRDSGLKNTSQGRGLFESWPAWLPLGRIPLDHCLVSRSIQVINKQLGPRVGSDHLPVVIELQVAVKEDGGSLR
jgi:endonuclease/exonuclease/phosphatase (EEP) superfamily protein YafD